MKKLAVSRESAEKQVTNLFDEYGLLDEKGDIDPVFVQSKFEDHQEAYSTFTRAVMHGRLSIMFDTDVLAQSTDEKGVGSGSNGMLPTFKHHYRAKTGACKDVVYSERQIDRLHDLSRRKSVDPLKVLHILSGESEDFFLNMGMQDWGLATAIATFFIRL